tara:strand:+ start:1112 stop:1441 length:330 start_codon:yes stop_codon:yes gene_type:complete
MATILAPQKGNYVPRRPRELDYMDEEGNVVEQESEEDYNALFGITEENPQGVGIDEGQQHRIQPLSDEPTSGVGRIGAREEEQGRKQMVETTQKASRLKKASILDPNPY